MTCERAAGLLHLIRQARWVPQRVLGEPIVLVLHLGYVFIALGFVLVGMALIDRFDIPELAGIHAWSAGAVGVMTLAVMTRATLGHTGREIRASTGTVVIYLAVLASAVVRIVASLFPAYASVLLEASAILWCVAFFGFAIIYGPMLLSSRVSE